MGIRYPWNSGRDAPVSTSCLFSINLFGGLILFQMHFLLKYNKSILCSYSGFFNVRWFFRDMANLRITFDALRASLNKVFATFLLFRDKMPKRENKVRIV